MEQTLTYMMGDINSLRKSLSETLRVHCKQARYATKTKCLQCKTLEERLSCPIKIAYKSQILFSDAGKEIGIGHKVVGVTCGKAR